MAAGHHDHRACDCGGGSCGGDVCRVIPGAASPLPTVDPQAWDVRRRRAVRRAAGGRSADAGSPQAISVLMLDVGGVVIPSLFESVAVPGFPAGPLAQEAGWRQVQDGHVTEREYWQALGTERPELDIAALWQRCSRVRGELRGALDALAGRVRVVAFTNDMAHFFGRDWPQRFPEMSAFDAIVEAAQLGVHKPDPEAFRAAARAVGERTERCLFVDDLAVNLDGACRAGMRTRLFDVRDPAGSVRQLLDDLALTDGEQAQAPRAFRTRASDGVGPRAFAVGGGTSRRASAVSFRREAAR